MMKLQFSLRAALLGVTLLSVALVWMINRASERGWTLISGGSLVFVRVEENRLTGRRTLKHVIGVRNVQDFAENPFALEDVERKLVSALHREGMLSDGHRSSAVFYFDSPHAFWRRNTTPSEVRAILDNVSIVAPESDFWGNCFRPTTDLGT